MRATTFRMGILIRQLRREFWLVLAAARQTMPVWGQLRQSATSFYEQQKKKENRKWLAIQV